MSIHPLQQTAAAIWFLVTFRLTARPPLLSFVVRRQKDESPAPLLNAGGQRPELTCLLLGLNDQLLSFDRHCHQKGGGFGQRGDVVDRDRLLVWVGVLPRQQV